MKQMLNLKQLLVCTCIIFVAACSKTTEPGIAPQSNQKTSFSEMMAENGENPDELMMQTTVESDNTAERQQKPIIRSLMRQIISNTVRLLILVSVDVRMLFQRLKQ